VESFQALPPTRNRSRTPVVVRRPWPLPKREGEQERDCESLTGHKDSALLCPQCGQVPSGGNAPESRSSTPTLAKRAVRMASVALTASSPEITRRKVAGAHRRDFASNAASLVRVRRNRSAVRTFVCSAVVSALTGARPE
jgi:hypothetical protein